MDRQQAIQLIAACTQLLQSSHMYMDHAAESQQRKSLQNIKQRVKRRNCGDNDLAAFYLAVRADAYGYNFRRFWIDAQSTHWVHRVMDGGILQERQFDQTFRMSRNSFCMLHGILSSFLFSILLMYLQSLISRKRIRDGD